MTGLTVKSVATRRYRGQRARRQGFYSRERTARLLQRLLRHLPPANDRVIFDAWADALVNGSAWYEQRPDGTMRRMAPIEWCEATIDAMKLPQSDEFAPPEV